MPALTINRCTQLNSLNFLGIDGHNDFDEPLASDSCSFKV